MKTIPIEVENLTAGYDGKPVIRNVSFKLLEGDFLAIIGPNGGGKTTLFRTILGLIEPMEGSVRIMGLPISEGQSYVGYVPQNERIDPAFPILTRDVVLGGLRGRKGMRPFYTKEEKEMAEKAMAYAEIEDAADKRVSRLSGGQLQRVFLARAIASHPKILMLDEPTASLDPSMKDCTYDILRKLNKEAGVSVMVITHDMSSISHDVKRVACLNHRMVYSDKPEITQEMIDIGFHCPPELIHIDHTNCNCGGHR